MKNPDAFGRLWKGPYPFTKEGLRQARETLQPGMTGYKPVEDDRLLEGESGKLAGIYVITLRGAPVYVGVSKRSVFTRLNSHFRGSGNKNVADALQDYRNLPDFNFYVWFCDGISASQMESYVLNSRERPGFNSRPEHKHHIQSIWMN